MRLDHASVIMPPMARFASKIVQPPSLKRDLLGGHFYSFRKDPTGFLTRLSKLGDVAAFKMGSQRGFLISDPKLIHDMLITNAHKFVKGRALQRAKSLLGNGLLTAEGAFHLRQRRMIQPAFHRQRISEYASAMVGAAEKMSNEWCHGETRDISNEMMRLTLRVVGRTLFNTNVEDETDEVAKAMTSLVSLFTYLLLPFSEFLEKLPLPQTMRFRKARNILNDVIFNIIDERRRSGEDAADLLSMLLLAHDEGDGSGMTDEQIRDEALTLFLAGHETTANALTWTWYLLSQDPEVEHKLHGELNRRLDGRSPTFDDISNLIYTQAVLAESMRLFPPAWTIGRLATESHEFGGYTVKKGDLILASQWVMHHDRRFWDDADSFKPERWLTLSVKEATQRFIYFPFGGGVRRCIGESFAWTEGILLLATLARNWKLRLDPKQKIGLSPMITLRPKFGMKMQLAARSAAGLRPASLSETAS
jgi:cytochrome P450